jgi:hypothetical protein
MGGKPMSGAEARKLVRMAQVGAGGLLASAAVLWAIDVPGLRNDPIVKPAVVAPEIKAGDAAKSAAAGAGAFTSETAIDVSTRLDLAVKKAPPPEPAKVEPVVAEAPVEHEKQANDDIKFLGTIREPSRTLAVVSIEGQQLVVSEGRRVGKTEFLGVSEDGIRVREGSDERTIEKSARSGSSVGWMKLASNTPVAPAAPAPNAGGRGLPNLTPEQLQAMRERGIDPVQAARMRDFFRDRGRGRARPEGGGAGGGATTPVPMDGARRRGGDDVSRENN